MIVETKKRRLLKTLSWRIFAFFLTFTLLIVITKLVTLSTLFAAVASFCDLIIKSVAYYTHESLWNRSNYGKKLEKSDGCTIWMTGLPCSGKTTIAKKLKKKLERDLLRVEHLDGDIVRKLPNWNLGFSKKDRNKNIRRIARISSYLSQKAITICSFVSPYKEARQLARDGSNTFIEVYINCPVEVCAERDVKGMYAKAKSGEIKGFTGVDDPYEVPENPELACYTNVETIDESANKIYEYLKNKGII
jgi:adenylylsulfate kinase